jgi:CRISPR/Cas system Type II protein with McrA/HNH and RuvC-like nuclease domain
MTVKRIERRKLRLLSLVKLKKYKKRTFEIVYHSAAEEE